jgi:putative CocE/NonD family hydrolase
MRKTGSVLLWLVFLLITLPQPAQAQSAQEVWIETEAMIPMRDGTHLYTMIYSPKNATEPLPILFERTPYGIGDLTGIPYEFATSYKELADDGYIFAFQDIRGKFKSEGKFVMLRSPRTGLEKVDEGTDTHDTIEWLLENAPNNNGRVGILGISYGGWLTVMAMIEPHPAVKAVSPQASPSSLFLGDDFFHNGAFRLSPSFGYAYMMETSKALNPYNYDQYDTFEWYLDLGPLSNVNDKYIHGVSPSWNDFMAHPTYDEFWQRQEVSHYLKSVTVPTLNVAGWWDAEDFYGPMKIYDVLEQYDTNQVNYLAVGPWRHGGWAGNGSELGALSFSPDPSLYFREKIQAPWFAYHLKDEGSLDFPEAQVYETGANSWRSYDTWPPSTETTPLRLYLRQD